MISSVILAIGLILFGFLIGTFSFFGMLHSFNDEIWPGLLISGLGMLVGYGVGIYGFVSIIFQIITAIKA